MTAEDVKARVAQIRTIADDFEAAHGMEDDLRKDVLFAIARGCPDPASLAKEALRTSKIQFSRYCA